MDTEWRSITGDMSFPPDSQVCYCLLLFSPRGALIPEGSDTTLATNSLLYFSFISVVLSFLPPPLFSYRTSVFSVSYSLIRFISSLFICIFISVSFICFRVSANFLPNFQPNFPSYHRPDFKANFLITERPSYLTSVQTHVYYCIFRYCIHRFYLPLDILGR